MGSMFVGMIVMFAGALLTMAVFSWVPGRDRATLRDSGSWPLALIGLAILASVLAMTIDDDLVPVVFVFGLAIACLVAWTREFVALMRQPDDAFPGQHDKLIWALLLIALPPLGMLAYWSYRRTQGREGATAKAAPLLRDWS